MISKDPYKLFLKTAYLAFVLIFIPFIFTCKKIEREAKVNTEAVSDITSTTAKAVGDIIDLGNRITDHGHCWSLSANPTIADFKKPLGASVTTGIFTSELQDLEQGKTYYVRAYVISKNEPLYGTDVSFATPANPVYVNSVIGNATPSVLEMTYNLTLANFVPAASAFMVQVNSVARIVNTVSISGTKVMLTLASEVINGDIVTVAYTKPSSNPLQTPSGGQAVTISAQTVTNATLCTAPSANTNAATNIGTTTATLNGTVNANSFSTTVTFEYGTTISYGSSITATPSPVTGGSNTAVSAGVSGLSPNTLYHYRIKVINCGGTTYGTDQTHITLCIAPSATTSVATSLTNTTVTLNGTVNANRCSSAVSFEYGLTTFFGQTSTAVQSPVSGTTLTSVSVGITGLTSGQTYHYRVKAVSAGGTTYGGDITFSCTVIDIDGNVYNTIPIGTQVWMAENLKTTKYNDGTAIPLVTDSTAWTGLTSAAYCWYNNNASTYKVTYGALYNWYAVDAASNGGKNVCPTGWHVPTDAEWTTLTTYLGGESVAGIKLKETGTTHWSSPNTGATNESGFTALPGGYRKNGAFDYIGNHGYWWSPSGEYYGSWNRAMIYNWSNVGRGFSNKSYGFSVRCLKD